MRLVLGFLMCLFVLLVGGSADAHAQDWTAESSIEAAFSWTPFCATYYQQVFVEGMGETRTCVFDGERLKVGMTYPDSGEVQLVVSFPLDSRHYVVDGVCNRVANCVYAPQTDTLLARYYSGTGLSAKVFKRFRQRIQRIPGSFPVHYSFDQTNPDFSFENSEGNPLLVEALAVSANGMWLALEYRNVGIMRIDLTSFEVRRVWANGSRYGWGVDPTIEMAISNDGVRLAVMGERSGLSITAINSHCGDRLRSQMYNVFDSPDHQCPLESVDDKEYGVGFHAAYDPVFSDDGKGLAFTVVSSSGEAKRVRLSKGAGGGPGLSYVALGDSFTSGEGETDDHYYLPGTNDPFEKCHVSRRAYPFLFARLMNFSTAKSVACSGAKMGDIVTFSGEYWGQGKRLGEGGLRVASTALISIHEEALASFHAGRIPQSEFIEKYHPEVATIGIGGNDAGLITKLRTCVGFGLCEWATNVHRTAEEIQRLFWKFVAMYQRLLALSPTTRWYAIGYPWPIELTGDCDPVTAALLQHEERVFMNEAVAYLNEVIRAAARRAGVRYVDMSAAFQGHELCSGSSESAMNGLRLGDDTTIGVLPFRLIGNESFHPTPFGHAMMAKQFEVIDDSEASLPAVPAYWGTTEAGRLTQAAEFVTPTKLTVRDANILLALPDESLLPGSAVRIELHSTPLQLAKGIADARGGFTFHVTIPEDVPYGFHTVHLLGTSPSGEEIELYQEIVYSESSPVEQKSEGMFEGGISTELNTTGELGVLAMMSDRQESSVQAVYRFAIEKSAFVYVIVAAGLAFITVVVVLLVRRRRAPDDS